MRSSPRPPTHLLSPGPWAHLAVVPNRPGGAEIVAIKSDQAKLLMAVAASVFGVLVLIVVLQYIRNRRIYSQYESLKGQGLPDTETELDDFQELDD